MRVLVTRPVPDAEALAGELRRLGHEPVLAPLLEIRASDRPLTEDHQSRTLLFTSANGARMARLRGLASTRPVFAVGEATASAARAAGFAVGGVATGDAQDLAQLVTGSLPRGARLLHVSGSEIAGDLVGTLKTAGFDAQRFVAYDAVAAERPPAAAAEFFCGTRGAALLFSPHTAAILVQLVRSAGLETRAAEHRALALSAAVAKEALGLPWRRIEVAARREQSALLVLL
jgi:uroporphyrinogen-III synthase